MAGLQCYALGGGGGVGGHVTIAWKSTQNHVCFQFKLYILFLVKELYPAPTIYPY